MLPILAVKKIAIIGGPGTGKTTLSYFLSKKYHLPLHHLDGIKYLKNWKQRTTEETKEIIFKAIQKDV